MGDANDYASWSLLIAQAAQTLISAALVYVFSRWVVWERARGRVVAMDQPVRMLVIALLVFQTATCIQGGFYTLNSVFGWGVPYAWRMAVVVPLKAVMIGATYVQLRSVVVMRRGTACIVPAAAVWVFSAAVLGLAGLYVFIL